MHVLLLVAGRSRRFWPLEEKSLTPLLGSTLLGVQLQRLKSAGCSKVTLVGGAHNLEEIRRQFPKIPAIEQENLDHGMQGALLSALPKIKGPVMVVSGNDVIEPAGYKALLKAAAKKGMGGGLLCRKVTRYFPGGYVTVKGGRITGIVEKPGDGKEPSDLVNIVAHVHNDPAALLAELRKTDPEGDDGYERALGKLFVQQTYVAVPYEGVWQAVKYPWHLLPLTALLLAEIRGRKISPKAKIHKSAVVDGNVIIEEGARLMPNACVVGPCYIGRNAVIGNNALVRGSSIGEGCVIGFNTEVKGSLLFQNVWTHMTYIGDSVVGANTSFGAGCITGNFRLDEREIKSSVSGNPVATGLAKFGAVIGSGCRLGIQIGINPGVKIGTGSFLTGGTLITEDIPEKSFVVLKDGKVTVKPNRSAPPDASARAQYVPGKK